MTFEDKEIEIQCMRMGLKDIIPILHKQSFTNKNIEEYILKFEDDDSNNTLILVVRLAIKLHKQKVKDAINKLDNFNFDGYDDDVVREEKSSQNQMYKRFLKKKLGLEWDRDYVRIAERDAMTGDGRYASVADADT